MQTFTEVQKFAAIATEKHLTVSAAESCTGGLIGSALTALPGASAFFLGSAVTYSNESKEKILGVPRGILFAYGAVSKQTAACMSKAVLELYGSDLAVAVTGIAGPAGGSFEKPVGLVYISVTNGTKTVTKKFFFNGNRSEVRVQTVFSAMRMLNELAESL